jgi:pimeloyl-ACP methyl ester carboxylesterase
MLAATPMKDVMSATLTADPRSALHPPPGARRRAPAASERWLYPAGISSLALHLVDTSLRGPATSLAGIALLLALAGLAIVVHPRLARRTRVAWSGVLGLMTAGAVGSSDGLRFLSAGPAWTELTGVVAALGGLALVAAAVAALRGPREEPRPHRLLRGAGWAASAVVVGAFAVFPLALALMTTHAPRIAVSESALGWSHREIRIPMRGGGEVAAWYVASRNRAAALLIHGSGGNRSRVADRARMLARHGYGVLVLDLPGNGESDGRSSGVGWTAQPGIDAALGFLAHRPEIDHHRIAGFGVSLGGEVLLEAAARDHRLGAVISDGAARSTIGSNLNTPAGPAGTLQKVQLQIGLRLIRASSGTRPAPPLEDVVGRIAPRPVLLIASGHGAEVNANRAYRNAAGARAELWTIPEATHTGGLRSRPAEYERRTTAFLDRAL